MLTSVVIAGYNEEENLSDCVESLIVQDCKRLEIILVDDGSVDSTLTLMGRLKEKYSTKKSSRVIKVISQSHRGPGVARNNGVSRATGSIIVFVDADMTFAGDFISELVKPIVSNPGKVNGTSSSNEKFSNPGSVIAMCWNIGRFAAAGVYSARVKSEIIPIKQEFGGIFRAIKRSEFIRVGGFDSDGDYADDLSLSRKLGYGAYPANSAILFHKNPSTISDMLVRAKWIGSSRQFTGGYFAKLASLFKYSFPLSIIKAIFVSMMFRYWQFIPFKIFYDFLIFITVLRSFMSVKIRSL